LELRPEPAHADLQLLFARIYLYALVEADLPGSSPSGRQKRCDFVDVGGNFLDVGKLSAVVEDAAVCLWKAGG